MMDGMIGQMVYIKDKESIYLNYWGIIVDFDGDCYHVAMMNDKTNVAVFERKQLHIPRKTEGK